MKFKNKGRKIYKTKEKNYRIKNNSGRFMSICLSVLLMGGIVFLGYSVAEPLLNYSKKQGDNDVSSVGNSNNPTETTTENLNAGFEATDDEDTSNKYNCSFLSRSSLSDIYSLEDALEEIKEVGTKYVAVPLKTSGGWIYYDSENRGANLSGAVSSYLMIDEIVEEIKDADLIPVAYMSVLNDNVYPATYPDAGYKIADSGSIWLDNSLENGGKPWLNPFTVEAVEYSKSIAEEITSAGFDKIIFADIKFPYLRQSDLEYIGSSVKSSKRYNTLVSLANELYSVAVNNDTAVMLEVSAEDIIEGNAEVLKQELLSISTIVVNIDFDELYSIESDDGMIYEFAGTASENAKKVMRIIKEDIEGFDVVIRLSGDSLYESELEDVQETLSNMGYKSYILG